jgi:hypothetical protein
MSEKHNEHQIIKDIRELRSYGEDVPSEEVYKREAIRMSLWSPEQRAGTLRDFDNRVDQYNENSNLRQKTQAHRFRSYLKAADQKLKLVGR